jgi:hypothetical protein
MMMQMDGSFVDPQMMFIQGLQNPSPRVRLHRITAPPHFQNQEIRPQLAADAKILDMKTALRTFPYLPGHCSILP